MRPRPAPADDDDDLTEDEEQAAEFIEWLMFALELPEVQAKVRACLPIHSAPPGPPPGSGRGAPRKRGR